MNGIKAMRDEDKPFICYQKGKWSFQIAPRNAAGWRAIAFWMLALVPIVGLFVWAISLELSRTLTGLFISLYIVAMLLWSIAMIRWTKARSEIVDMQELLKIKREQDIARKKRGGLR